MTSENKPKEPYKLPNFSEALKATRQMQQDWLEHGSDFVTLYVEDVDGDWLEKWGEDEESEDGASTQAPKDTRFVDALQVFLSSDDPVAVQVRDYWEARSLSEISEHLEKCLSLSDIEKPYAVQELILENSMIANHTRESGSNNKRAEILDLAEKLLEKLLEIQQHYS
ncbi:hypothetical protein K9N68_07025 [Kovacikia minuta CCNUW1]|uniref:hypothetical protein n=1 Tax=Kovacikia minuta TaxID=2931930 RepID=UPI001CCB38C8|nr:hypothetical protein [Kovacikia minuta]UBF27665.1 hypothetical protein K9N68_07025 [Kovacikia minuta CCNUW1]